MGTVVDIVKSMSDQELLAALFDEMPPVDYDLHLRPGETLADRIPAKIAKGRAVAAEKRRAMFRIV